MPRSFATRRLIDDNLRLAGVTPLVRVEMESVEALVGVCRYSDLASIVPERAALQAPDLHTLEQQHIRAILDSVQGDKTRAAQLLGISRRTLERRCAEWSLP